MKLKSESEVAQSCPTLSDPLDCSLPGSSVHGIFQARVLEWGAIAFSMTFHLTPKRFFFSVPCLLKHLNLSFIHPLPVLLSQHTQTQVVDYFISEIAFKSIPSFLISFLLP